MRLAPAIPILRIFSEDKAKEFYLYFLGFSLEWEHRFGDNFPLYARIKRSELIIDLSEHYGDATPGATIFVPVENIDVLSSELRAKQYRYAKPAIDAVPWGRVMEISDPFGNRLRFSEAGESDVAANP
jgi:Glyoxalase superfamily protein